MEKCNVESHRGSSLLYFLAGLGSGVALAVLFTPRSGAATRRLIGRKAEEGEGWMKNKATEAQDYVKGQGERLRDRVKDVAEVIGRN
jgi:gas vesicle protein